MFLLSDLFGLPAHTLLVHAAVVLVPLAAVAYAAVGWKSDWRLQYRLPIVALALIGAVSTFLAKQSGEAIQSTVRDAAAAAGAARPRFGDHPEQGDAAMVWAFLFAMAVVGAFAVDYWYRREQGSTERRMPSWAPIASYAVTLVPAALAILTMVAAGHSGARLVWHDVGNFVHG